MCRVLSHFAAEANPATFAGFHFRLDFPAKNCGTDFIRCSGEVRCIDDVDHARSLTSLDVFKSWRQVVQDYNILDRLLTRVVETNGEGDFVARVGKCVGGNFANPNTSIFQLINMKFFWLESVFNLQSFVFAKAA